jgi:exonuclease III
MIKTCDEKLLRKFDCQQDYLWLYNSAKGRSGGILVGVRKEYYDVGSFHQGEFMLQLNLGDKINKMKWNLLVVYGAAHDDLKMQFLSELSSFCSKHSEPLVIGGDFNIIRYSFERNKAGGVQRFSGLFNTLINFHELREIVMSGEAFTWSKNQDDPLLEKLDRILISKDWEDIFPHAMVRKLPREVSDHNPLILSSGQYKPLKFIQFNFELSWLNNPDFF